MTIDLVKNISDLKQNKKNKWIDLLNISGVYIFTYRNKILYIGRSKNLYKRMLSHYSNGGICNGFKWDKIHFIFCENHKEIEKQMILDYNPLLNGSLTSKLYYK
jgi:excinuclease UvrABC nuclease subunit